MVNLKETFDFHLNAINFEGDLHVGKLATLYKTCYHREQRRSFRMNK